MIDYWDILSGVLLTIIGAYNVWLSRSAHFEANPFTAWLSRMLKGVGRARFLTLVIGVFCLLIGVVSIIVALADSQ